jgi:hypothetical protein
MVRRIFLVTALLFGSAEGAFRHTKEVRLKKDVTQKVLVKREDTEQLLTFRWTLYENGDLVMHRSYDGFNAQNVLRMNHKNQSVRVAIERRGADPRAFTYIVIKFKAFDAARSEAVFELLLKDDAEKAELKYLKRAE